MLKRGLPGWLEWAMDREQARRAPFLAHSPLFAGLPRRLLGRLATRFLEKAYSAGEVVFHEGDPGRALFVVVEGAVEITQATPRGEYLVRTLGAGTPSASSPSSTSPGAPAARGSPRRRGCSSSTRPTSTR